MGENSSIQWTHHTFNVVHGCQKISEACDHCYASEAYVTKVYEGQHGVRLWGPPKTTERRVLGDDYWTKPLKWDRAAAKAGERHRVFCSSMADVFEDHPVVASQRERLWPLIEATPNLDWLLLTKRPENILSMVPERWRHLLPRNVWVGTTVESQKRAEERVPHLIKVPAAVRFLSVEPLLEAVDLSDLVLVDGDRNWSGCECDGENAPCEVCDANGPCAQIDWLILGGESGPKARPFHLEWARYFVDWCETARVHCFVKQLGARPVVEHPCAAPGNCTGDDVHLVPVKLRDSHGGDWNEWPPDLRVRQFPEVSRG